MRGYRVVNAPEKAAACYRPAMNDWRHSPTLSASVADMNGGTKLRSQRLSATETCLKVRIPVISAEELLRKLH